jgi:formylglycine-generating enzyme required for sulfatase activity
MVKIKEIKKVKGVLLVAGFVLWASCSSPMIGGDGGELTGVRGRAWTEPNPYGMILIKNGTFAMGLAENDTTLGLFKNAKGVSIDNFWMDETEVTNAEYRQFVHWVRDSIIRERLYDPAFGGNQVFKITEDGNGNPIEMPILDWNRPIPNERRATEDELRAINSVNWTNPITGEKKLDADQMIYRFSVFDETGYALRRHQLNPAKRVRNTDIAVNPNEIIMISKDTAYVNDAGIIISETITRPLSGIWDFLNTYILNIYPDEAAWVNDFNNSYNEPYMRQYFNYPGFDDYPVVGVSWEQARAFCAWRTDRLKRSLKNEAHRALLEPYRLPTEAEFEYAARSGKSKNKYPWQQDTPVGDKDCFLGNFKPGDGNYTQDCFLTTSRVGSFLPNEFGLYDMAGNVAEWTSSAYLESGLEIMNDINPEYVYNVAKEDPYAMKKKVVRGGSWKDVGQNIRSDIRSFEYQNEQRSYIGFRCVRSQLGSLNSKR